MNRYKISEYAKLKGVVYKTVWRWVKNNIVKYERLPSGGIRILSNEE